MERSYNIILKIIDILRFILYKNNMLYFQIYKYNDNLYQIRDSISVLSTLVIGDKQALLFDTCYGIGDLLAEVEKLTDKPLIVVNSHGHMDHSCGNYQFPYVYITEDDYELCLKHNSKDRRMRNIKAANKRLLGFPWWSSS